MNVWDENKFYVLIKKRDSVCINSMTVQVKVFSNSDFKYLDVYAHFSL